MTLRPAQHGGLHFAIGRNFRAMLAMDPGLGKTLTALRALGHYGTDYPRFRCLVLSTLRSCTITWPAELALWAPGLRWGQAAGVSPKARAAVLEDPTRQVVLLNFENIGWFKEWVEKRGKLGFCFLIVDESHRLKAGSGKRFLSLRGLLHGFRGRLLLTGTPMPYARTDLYSQALLIDDGVALGSRLGPAAPGKPKVTFRDRFCTYEWTHREGGIYVVPDSLWPAMRDTLSPLVYVARLADCDVPALIERPVYVDLPRDARRAYDEIERNMDPSAPTAGAVWAACYQLAGGFRYGPDGEAVWMHREKLDALEGLLSQLGGDPVLLVAVHTAELDAIQKLCTSLHLKLARVDGKTSRSATERAILDWNNGTLQVLLAQTACVAESLNLQAGGRHVVHYSTTTRWDHVDQVRRRLWRPGQTRAVMVHYLVARQTVDEPIMAMAKRRESAHLDFHTEVRKYLEGRR